MGDDDFFWEGVDQGRLLAQMCTGCKTLRHPPAPMCGRCHSLSWTAHELSGCGTVFAWLISNHPTRPDEMPRTVILVDLAEGLRMVSNLVGGGAAEIGMPVALTFGDVDNQRLPQFCKVEAANASA